MKRNKFFMLGIVTVLVAVLSLTFVSNTFAKYTSKVTASDSAQVAKWSWTIEDKTFGNGGTAFANFECDLFSTIVDTKDGNSDEDVNANLIAPGTKGSFTLNIKNNSEVDATYEIDFNVTTNGVPLKFKVNTVDNGNDLNDIAAVELEPNGQAEITIEWEWPFHVDADADVDDTDLGILAPEVTVAANIIFTQVD